MVAGVRLGSDACRVGWSYGRCMSTAGLRVVRKAALVVGLVTFFVLGTLATIATYLTLGYAYGPIFLTAPVAIYAVDVTT